MSSTTVTELLVKINRSHQLCATLTVKVVIAVSLSHVVRPSRSRVIDAKFMYHAAVTRR